MLKDFIQWLLNTRTTPAEAAHSARSLFSAPITFSGKTSAGEAWTDNLVTGISPKDGYLNISASTVNSENFGTMLQVTSNEVQLSQVSSTSGQGLNFLLPITKGAQFSVNGIRAKDIAVRFFESLGGGYNNLLKEVQLCLRTSCNFYLKPSLKARKNGYLDSLSRPLETTLTLIPKSTFRRVMAGLGFIEVKAPTEICSIFSLLVKLLKTLLQELCLVQTNFHSEPAQQSLLKKAVRLFLTKLQELLSFGFLRQLAVNPKFNKGGALC